MLKLWSLKNNLKQAKNLLSLPFESAFCDFVTPALGALTVSTSNFLTASRRSCPNFQTRKFRKKWKKYDRLPFWIQKKHWKLLILKVYLTLEKSCICHSCPWNLVAVTLAQWFATCLQKRPSTKVSRQTVQLQLQNRKKNIEKWYEIHRNTSNHSAWQRGNSICRCRAGFVNFCNLSIFTSQKAWQFDSIRNIQKLRSVYSPIRHYIPM